MAQGAHLARPEIRHPDAVIGEVGVGDQPLAVPAETPVPRVEGHQRVLRTGVDVDAAHSVRPVHERQLPPMGHPRLMRDPLRRTAGVEASIAGAVPIHHPHPVIQRTGIEEQRRVLRMELLMADGVPPQDGFPLPGDGVDDSKACLGTFIELHRPPAIVPTQRGGPHRRPDHAVLAHRDAAEGGELL